MLHFHWFGIIFSFCQSSGYSYEYLIPFLDHRQCRYFCPIPIIHIWCYSFTAFNFSVLLLSATNVFLHSVTVLKSTCNQNMSMSAMHQNNRAGLITFSHVETCSSLTFLLAFASPLWILTLKRWVQYLEQR